VSVAVAIAPLLHAFFTDYLLRQRRASPQTVASYRDTFRLLLQHIHQKTSRQPSILTLEDFQVQPILEFLDHIEKERGNSIQTRNVRLAAIRSFFRLVALREPTSINQASQVLSIPVKRADRRLIGYLNRPEIDAILATPDLQTWIGRRDYGLLLTLYNTGARIAEVLAARPHQFTFGATSVFSIHGKGRKERSVALWPTTSRTLRNWIAECGTNAGQVLFPNARGGSLSRDGADYILQQAVQRAIPGCPSLQGKPVSPHVIRHTTAMHLHQSGVDITVIALWLGHESLDTTHVYVEADLRMKEQALGKVVPVDGGFSRFKPDDALLEFLANL
jgi:integrase/recombinase XerD